MEAVRILQVADMFKAFYKRLLRNILADGLSAGNQISRSDRFILVFLEYLVERIRISLLHH